jgi:hypothetical protein
LLVVVIEERFISACFARSFGSGSKRWRKEKVLVVVIEERFLSAQADAFTGSEREEKASACFARNDS